MYIRVVGKEVDYFRNKDIILFGCGSCGERAVEEFEKIGSNIIGFCDNSRKKIGKRFNGYIVLSPESLRLYPNAKIIITSTFEKEIELQLQDMGISDFYNIKVGVLKEVLEKNDFINLISSDGANNMLINGLNGTSPFFVGRIGSVELECLAHYLFFNNRLSLKPESYPNNVKMMMRINAGFFPTEDNFMDNFCNLYLQDLKEMDMIWTMWFSKYEDIIYRKYFNGKKIAEYDSTVFPIEHTKPWTIALEGKKVLVIHPFDESIKQNYLNREKLFGNKLFLPNFELITLQAVQSIACNKTEFENWFEALQYMESKIEKIEFDIALIGAGAYGLALGAYIKRLGKKAVHIGGILQLFFGIKGKAWDKLKIYNEYWISPKDTETPNDYNKVEAGRYW